LNSVQASCLIPIPENINTPGENKYMAFRLEILAHKDDGRAKQIENILGGKASVRVVDVYTSEANLAANQNFVAAVCNPVSQEANPKLPDFDYALEIGFLPGVTDNIGHTASEILTLSGENTPVYSSRLYLIKGGVKESDIQSLSDALSNKLIQRRHIKDSKAFAKDGGMEAVIPAVHLDNKGAVADSVDLDIPDSALEKLGKDGIENADGTRRGPLGLSLLYLKAIQAYFRQEGRQATDIEIETLAQTWSEHCKHTIFASPIDDITDGLYRHYIKRATKEIRENRGKDDICISVFSDNAGAIIFDKDWLITDKVETHNSPSALDPFGGAITGIVGVNRDCLGFGQGAKPVINRYGFCVADPRTSPKYYRDPALTNPILSPATILSGVVAGVEAGGNQSGIPTPQGFVYFDERYIGKPLVFAGTVGLIPRTINGKPSHEKKAQPGDCIVMVGGRVGRDGIHGATFSSVALDEGSPATAVQIGDPITQKKFSDAIIKEIRDLGLYNAITDNGAGGLSSSVGEMGEQSGGFHVELEKVPLKYPGMAPWEIWISESQERMTLAVPSKNVQELTERLARHGAEASVIGTYTDTGRAVISWHGETIMDMAMEFLHDGNPDTPLKTTFTRGGAKEPDLKEPKDYAATLTALLARPNIASKEFIASQYDHNVQGSAVLGPVQGKGRVMGDASITKPVLSNPRGVVLSQGLFPRYSDIDTKEMARAGLDFAVRAAVAAGVDFHHLALLDNICWCSSDDPARLGQLKRAIEGIYDLAVSYKTPFISGKDSMFNDFKGYDANGKPVLISAPPTLLTSAIGVIPNVDQAISIAPKAVGDIVCLLGETRDECGAGEYYDLLGHTGNNVPETRDEVNRKLYQRYGQAARKHLIASSMAVGYGGLAVTLAKKAIAGKLGLEIKLPEADLRADKFLFSESTGRMVVTIAPQNVKAFEKALSGYEHIQMIGHVAYSEKLKINNIIECDLQNLEEAYKSTFKEY
jgi:phosphoribosylformylglycinamidine synthase